MIDCDDDEDEDNGRVGKRAHRIKYGYRLKVTTPRSAIQFKGGVEFHKAKGRG